MSGGGKTYWQKHHDGWEKRGTTTRGATLHATDDPAHGDSFRLRNSGESPAPRLACFKVRGEMYHAGVGQRDYAPAEYQIYRVIEESPTHIVGIELCTFPVRARADR